MRYLIAVAMASAWLGSAGAAEIYCNKQGLNCSDRPTPGSIAVNVAAGARVSDSATTAAPAANTTGDPVANQQQQNIEQAKARDAMRKDLADKRSAQCKKAQEYYQKTLESNRLFREDKDKKQVFLSDTEVDQERLNARIQVNQNCGSG